MKVAFIMAALQISLLVAGTLALAYVSRSALRQTRSHGFYRFFA